MRQDSKVFLICALEQADVFFVNGIFQLLNESEMIDHAVVLTDSQNVFEAAAIAGLSAHTISFVKGGFAKNLAQYFASPDVYIDEDLDAWFLYLDAGQPILSLQEIHSVFDRLKSEQCISVFRSESTPSARFFTPRAFQADASFIEADIQWINLTTNEMYR
jgi:2-C-methyl-D-erythritol 4-phosphate cytidylyltransferase